MPASVTFLSIIESEVGILHHNQKSILHCIVTSIIPFIHINCNIEMSENQCVFLNVVNTQLGTSNTGKLFFLFPLVTFLYLLIALPY